MTPVELVPLAGVAGFLLLIGGGAALARTLERRRREAFTAFGAERGLAFGDRDPTALEALAAFQLGRRGHGHQVKNVLRGRTPDGEVLVGDYSWRTGGGKNQVTHAQTVCVLRTPGRPCPTFQARPQRALDPLGKLLGGQDLDFPDDRAFSKKWVLQGPDEGAVRRHFTPRLRGWFTENLDGSVLVEAVGDALLVHRGRVLKPGELPALLAQATNVRRHWS